MKQPMWWSTALLFFLAACPGKPCRAADVAVVIQDCRVAPAYGPDYRPCQSAGLARPPDFDVLAHDVEACSAQGGGDTFACLAQNSHRCRTDGGLISFDATNSAIESCTSGGSSGASSPAEWSSSRDCLTCTDALRRCEAACPVTDWNECANCDARCHLAFGACQERCS
jgi:hypothetical protein